MPCACHAQQAHGTERDFDWYDQDKTQTTVATSDNHQRENESGGLTELGREICWVPYKRNTTGVTDYGVGLKGHGLLVLSWEISQALGGVCMPQVQNTFEFS